MFSSFNEQVKNKNEMKNYKIENNTIENGNLKNDNIENGNMKNDNIENDIIKNQWCCRHLYQFHELINIHKPHLHMYLIFGSKLREIKQALKHESIVASI